MVNVYDRVKAFYDECETLDLLIDEDIAERYLRQKAWQGHNDSELQIIWDVLEWVNNYAVDQDVIDFTEFDTEHYHLLFFWICDNSDVFTAEETTVRTFFTIWSDFFQYLDERGIDVDMKSLDGLVESFFKDGRLIDFDWRGAMKPAEFDYDNLDMSVDQLNFMLETLLNKIGDYYRQERFINDFNRAIAFFSGPFNMTDKEEDSEFWLGFWDYFLFDYHLLDHDVQPLRYFYEQNKQTLSPEELYIIGDLLKAKFTVFYIEQVLSGGFISCVNLFTGEKFQLPLPERSMNNYKRALFFGHVYAAGIIMLNYISSMSVSPLLRNRIRDEVLRQYKQYLFQCPEAEIDDFFARHAVLVRHTVDILLNMSRVNVINYEAKKEYFPNVDVTGDDDSPITAQHLPKLAEKCNLGRYATDLLKAMGRDFSSLASVKTTDCEKAAKCLFITFARLNGMRFAYKKDVLKSFGLTKQQFDDWQARVAQTLNLQLFDPRYLTEDGFIYALYAFQ